MRRIEMSEVEEDEREGSTSRVSSEDEPLSDDEVESWYGFDQEDDDIDVSIDVDVDVDVDVKEQIPVRSLGDEFQKIQQKSEKEYFEKLRVLEKKAKRKQARLEVLLEGKSE